jgi:hypothetical protein
MPIDRDILHRASTATCAIGWLSCPLDEYRANPRSACLRVVGTGFRARGRTIVTAEHVLSKTVAERDARGHPHDLLVVVFFVPDAIGMTIRIYSWRERGWTHPPLDDLGVVRIEETNDDRLNELGLLTPPAVWNNSIGDAVGILGYPFGSGGMVRPADPKRVYRVGPVLQQGYISAIAPFGQCAQIERILLDVRTAKGMSGAAVIDATTGAAIGVHTSGYESEPATLAFAEPFTSSVLDALDAALDTPRRDREERRDIPFELPTTPRH